MTDDVLIDPNWLHSGAFGDYGACEDIYFAQERVDCAFADVLDELVEQLPEPERQIMQRRVFERWSFREIAVDLGWFYGKPPIPNKKRVWRRERRAASLLRKELADRVAWLAPLTDYPIESYLESP